MPIPQPRGDGLRLRPGLSELTALELGLAGDFRYESQNVHTLIENGHVAGTS